MDDREFVSDEELALEAQHGNAESFELLLTRFKPLVRSQASQYFLSGGDHDDLIQEGMIGLFKAVRVYDVRSGSRFAALAKTTVHNSILDALKRDQAVKQQALNQSKSLSADDSTDSTDMNHKDKLLAQDERSFRGTNLSPLDGIEAGEAASRIVSLMTEQLSKRELSVLLASIRGLQTREIAAELQLNDKQIIGALARARRKLKEAIG